MVFRSLTARWAIICTGVALFASIFLLDDRASAETYFQADYVVSFARITVGNIAVSADVGSAEYVISANGRVGGAMRLLMNGQAHLATRGTLADARPTPSDFIFKINSPDDPLDVHMLIENGDVTELTALPRSSEDVPLGKVDRQGILDPLSALLIPAGDTGDGLVKEACQRTLPIFDGRQRYDLQLAFKRFDKITVDKGYAGPVVVCSVSYLPIAGHRLSTPLAKYVAESREIECAFAPLVGARLLAPIRVLVMNMLANLVIQANRFEVATQPSSPSNSHPDP